MQKESLKKNWLITSTAFRQLLEWLDEGENSDGRNYLEMRRRLVIYFDRKNCLSPDELADETLNRVARRLEEAGKIESETPAKYCYITARFVFMEYLRTADKTNVSLDDVSERRHVNAPLAAAASDETEQREVREIMLGCLEQCLAKLETSNRTIIISYYYGAERVKIENRRALAQSLEVTTNALSVRACRIRDKLEDCVKKCAGEN